MILSYTAGKRISTLTGTVSALTMHIETATVIIADAPCTRFK
jgi:hypothetical protein